MFRKSIMIFTVTVFMMGSILSVMASEGPDGNKRKGKYTYRKVYKACSAAGEATSATPTVSPADKTMSQWKDIFESRNFDEFGCLTHWAALSDSDIQDIYSYFYHHASDSPTPAKCQ